MVHKPRSTAYGDQIVLTEYRVRKIALRYELTGELVAGLKIAAVRMRAEQDVLFLKTLRLVFEKGAKCGKTQLRRDVIW